MEKLLELRRKANSIAELCGLLHAATVDEAVMHLQLSVQANDLQLAIPLPMSASDAHNIISAELSRLAGELDLSLEQLRKLAFPSAVHTASAPLVSTPVMWYEQQAVGQGGI